MKKLDSIDSKSRTARLWLDALIWPVFLIMRFVRAGREADRPLHIDTLKRMLPYFAAAGHWHCFRYAIVYLMKMTKLPKELFGKFIDGEHAMRHQNGIWNAMWSDMMIETTVMRYGHGLTGMKGLTFNEKALDRWSKSLHISSIMEKCLLDLKDSATTSDVIYHKEEGSARVKEDGQDREKTRAFLSTGINPLDADEHAPEIVKIYSGKLSIRDFNVDQCVQLGGAQVEAFQNSLPDGFYR